MIYIWVHIFHNVTCNIWQIIHNYNISVSHQKAYMISAGIQLVTAIWTTNFLRRNSWIMANTDHTCISKSSSDSFILKMYSEFFFFLGRRNQMIWKISG